MYKDIFAAIVTLYETKTLHVIEELHGTVGPFASRFALRTTCGRVAITATEAAAIITARSTVTVKRWTVRARSAFADGHRFTVDHEIGRRHFTTTFHQLEF
jgi:hypothetical protein